MFPDCNFCSKGRHFTPLGFSRNAFEASSYCCTLASSAQSGTHKMISMPLRATSKPKTCSCRGVFCVISWLLKSYATMFGGVYLGS